MLFAVYILYVNQEVLYTAHNRSEFISGTPFFHSLLSKPFGLMQYAGAWLTQLLCQPAFGATILVAIWVLIFFVGSKAFRLQGSASALMLLPVACLLTSVVDLGYWIYISPIRGYWFSQSVGYLVMLLLLWAARCTPRKYHWVWYLGGAVIYPMLGWFALLFVVCLLVSEKPSWRELLGIVMLLFTIPIWYTQAYSNLQYADVVLAGLPRFFTSLDHSGQLSVPFYVLGAMSIFIPLCSRYMHKKFVPVLCAVTGIVFVCSFMYHDQNYVDEMRMVRYAENDDWKQVLAVVKDNKKPTNTMVFLKNVALMHEGGLLECSFKSGNISFPVNTTNTLHVGFLEIVSPLVYYNYGMMNEAIRLCFENAIPRGFSPFYLKILSRCALAKGDQKLLKRYSGLLHRLPFCSHWQPRPIAAKVRELQNCYPDELSGVENSDSYIVNSISLWYQSNSKVASEQALFYTMLRCEAHHFWPSLRQYLRMHNGEDFPVHAQEAYILFMDKAPEERRMMIPVEETIFNRYKKFSEAVSILVKPGKTIGQVAEEMRGEWGDTYWYYDFFGKQYSNVVDRKENEVAS